MDQEMDTTTIFISQSDCVSVADTEDSSSSFGSISASQLIPVDYKIILQEVKCVAKQTDSLSERICDLNVRFGDDMCKTASLVDPEVNQIMHKKDKEGNHPDFMTLSQQNRVPTDDIEMKYDDVCRLLLERNCENGPFSQGTLNGTPNSSG